MYKTWNEYSWDIIEDYLKKDVEATKSLYHRIPRNLCYGITKPTAKVKRVIFNNPATIIFWTDNTKTVVQCQPCDTYDKETGFVMAYLKKLLGNDNTFNKEINKWVWND